MKRLILGFILAMSCFTQCFAFNPDPTKYEFVGQKDDGCYIFYEISTAKAEGDRASVVVLQADPKKRTLRCYDLVINSQMMTVTGRDCKLYDYKGNLLDNFVLPSQSVSYKLGDLTDKIYRNLCANDRTRSFTYSPATVANINTSAPIQKWQQGMTSGDELMTDIMVFDPAVVSF